MVERPRRATGDGRRGRIKDPFTQALDHRYDLERKIDGVKGWRGKDLLIIHAVALPDVTVHQLVLAPDAPRAILLDRHDVRDRIAGAIERVITYHRGARDKRRAPGPEGAEMLRELLAPSVSLRMPMAEEILDEEEALIRLTAEQSLGMAHLARNKRLVVYGCAGSGKTMLAVEHAKRRRLRVRVRDRQQRPVEHLADVAVPITRLRFSQVAGWATRPPPFSPVQAG